MAIIALILLALVALAIVPGLFRLTHLAVAIVGVGFIGLVVFGWLQGQIVTGQLIHTVTPLAAIFGMFLAVLFFAWAFSYIPPLPKRGVKQPSSE